MTACAFVDDRFVMQVACISCILRIRLIFVVKNIYRYQDSLRKVAAFETGCFRPASARTDNLLRFLQDPDLHVKHLKPSPAASSIVNRCIECGFCESNCPSRDITLTPRQRITTYREISRLRDIGERTDVQQQRLNDFEKSYDYDGDATCAADGMCQVKCPVKINTGELIKQLRSDELEGGEHPRATKGAMVSTGIIHRLLFLC